MASLVVGTSELFDDPAAASATRIPAPVVRSPPLLVKLRNRIRNFSLVYRSHWLRSVIGYDIGTECRISHKAILDRANPRGLHIGSYTGVAFGAVIFSHDFVRNQHVETRIGDRCSIGANAIIYPGVTIGDGCLVAPGSVVTVSIPAGSVVAGNPARIIEKNIVVGKWGVRIDKLAAHRIDADVLDFARPAS